MEFTGFTAEDFKAMQVPGLEERMQVIKERIQPKFNAIGSVLAEELSVRVGQEMFLHIAKHARRTKNPPRDTWLAVSHDKRGYKKHPHFEVGLFDDFLFIRLAYIYELPDKGKLANILLNNSDSLKKLPDDFVVFVDHQSKEAVPLAQANLKEILDRFGTVKKAEFLLGRNILPDDPVLSDGQRFTTFTLDTFDHLVPIYLLTRQ